MFSLDRNKNDSSVALDLVRAVAAQVVCVGHAWNLSYENGTPFQLTINENVTYLPYVGVMGFFVLSGFVIAHTLFSKTSASNSYSLRHYVIERFARVYSAYLPALLLVALLDIVAYRLGAPMALGSLIVFLKNVLMLQGYPSNLGAPTFGTAGQLTSLAAEFHIYFFVGGIFFFCLGRNRFAGLTLAVLFASMPLAYFTEIPGSDRNLFVLWMLGFAGYTVVRSMTIDRVAIIVAALLAPIFVIEWIAGRSVGNEYAVSGYPMFAFAFLAIIVAAQGSSIASPVQRTIGVIAGYSYSLFLVHYSLEKIIIYWWPGPKFTAFVGAVILSNIMAFFFAKYTEARHKEFAGWLIARTQFRSATSSENKEDGVATCLPGNILR